jgi:hypothetical protein
LWLLPLWAAACGDDAAPPASPPRPDAESAPTPDAGGGFDVDETPDAAPAELDAAIDPDSGKSQPDATVATPTKNTDPTPAPEPLPPPIELSPPSAGACAFDPRPPPATTVNNAACPDGVFHGDARVRDAADIEQLKRCTHLAGNLTIELAELARLDGLESLRVIEGALLIPSPTCAEGSCFGANASLTSLRGLDNLRCVGRDVSVNQPNGAGCNALDVRALRKLVEVGGTLTLSMCARSDADRLESLQRVWGDLATNTELNPGRLEDVYGALVQDGPIGSFRRDMYVGCSAGTAPCRDGILGCSYQATSDVELAPLASCQLAVRDVTVSGPDLTDLTPLRTLREVRGRLTLARLPHVASLQVIAGLTRVESIRIEDLDALPDLVGLDLLTALAGELWIGGNAKLETLTGLTLTTAGEVHLVDNPALSSLGALATLAGPLERLELRSLPSLNSLDGLQQVTSIRFLDVVDCSGLIDLSELTLGASEIIQLFDNPSLSTLQGVLLPSLTKVAEVRLRALPSIQDLSGLEALQTIGVLHLEDCAEVRSLEGLSELREVTQALRLERCARLANLSGAPVLARIGVLQLASNPELATLAGLSALQSTDLHLTDLPALPGLQALTSVEIGSIELERLPLVADLSGLASARETLWSIELADNAVLADLTALSHVTALDGSLTVHDNALLRNLHGLDGLRRVASASITDNALLEDVRALAGLTKGEVTVSGNPSLPACEVLWLSERLQTPIPAAANGPPGSCPP